MLSQWRAYASAGDGVSIGFGPQSLIDIASNNASTIVRCLYDDDQQEELIKTSVFLSIQGARGGESDSELESSFLNFSRIVAFVAPALKHPSFAEEREWRIVRMADPISDIHFRSRGNAAVPYLNLTLGMQNEDLRLDSLTLGPTRNRELALAATRNMIRNLGVECRDVKFSTTPYRS